MKTITVTFTEEQARCVRDAVDLLDRLKLGQTEEVWRSYEREAHKRYPNSKEYCEAREKAEQLLFELKMLLFPSDYGRNASHGVGHPSLTKYDNRLYEIYKVFDHALWKCRNPNKDDDFCTSAGDPYLLNFSGDKRIPFKIEELDDTGTNCNI